MRRGLLAVSVLLGTGLCFPAQANLLVNHSLENGTDPGSIGRRLGVGSTEISGWVVSRGEVDYTASYWQSADWLRTVDLNGGSGAAGGIQQTIATVPGTAYVVTFALAGNVDGAPAVKHLRVEAAGQTGDFTFDKTGYTRSNMGYVDRTWQFTATGTSTTLEIYSLDLGYYGPVIDDICILPQSADASMVNQSFHDGFDGSTLSSSWVSSANGGSVVINGGIVTLSSTGAGFPYIRNATSAIPAGDFRLTFRLKFNSMATRGAALCWSDQLPSNGDTSFWCHTSVPSFAVYEDAAVARERFQTALLDPCNQRNLDLSSTEDLDWHTFEFSRIGARLTLSRDDVVVWSRDHSFGSSFPLNIWFGNPANVGTSGPWTSLSISDIAVYAGSGLSSGCSFADFSRADGLILCGSSRTSNAELVLVPNSTSLVGGAFWAQPISATSFSTDFRFRFRNLVGGGSDGFTFCVRGPGSILPGSGAGGGGLGFAGTGQSVGVEVDIWNNGGADPNGNHLGIDVGPGIQSLVTRADPLGSSVSLKDGNIYHIWVDYNGQAMQVAIARDGVAKPAPVLTQALILPFLVGMAGFTAATGGSAADHEILSWNFTFQQIALCVSAEVRPNHDDDSYMTVPLQGATAYFVSGAYRTDPVVTDAAGSAIFQVPCSVVLGGHYEVQLRGPSYDVKAAWHKGLPTDPITKTAEIATSGSVTSWTWGHGNSAIDEGPALQAAYFVDKFRREFWLNRLGYHWRRDYPSSQTMAITIRQDPVGQGVGADIEKAPADRYGLGLLFSKGDPFATVKSEEADVVYHEYVHCVIPDLFDQLKGHPRGNPRKTLGTSNDDQGNAMDEAFADYFAAAFTEDSIIDRHATMVFPRYHGIPLIPHWQSRRDISEFRPLRLPWQEDRYSGSHILSGALWEIRTHTAPSAQTQFDSLVFQGLVRMIATNTEAAEFSLVDFGDALLEVTQGTDFHGRAQDVFLRHNITHTPAQLPTLFWPQNEAIVQVASVADSIQFSWHHLPGAASYTVLVSPTWHDSLLSLGDYVPIASGIADTTFTFFGRDPRTEYYFSVVAQDSAGLSGGHSNPIYVEAVDATVVAIQERRVVPTRGRWMFNSPNPFNPTTYIHFETTAPSDAIVCEIYTVAGRVVWRSSAQKFADGRHVLVWNGRDLGGRRVASGKYYARLIGRGWSDTGTLVLIN